MELKDIYKVAAKIAFEEGIDAGDETMVLEWIRKTCSYRPDTEFFLVLGIGAELADLEAQKQGYDSEAHRAFEYAINKPGMREKHERHMRHSR